MFGVSTEEIEAMVKGLPLSATSSPSVTQVEEWITQHDLIVQGIFSAKGVILGAIEVGSTGYAYGHQAVLKAATAQILRATQGRFDEAAECRIEYDKSILDLKEWIHVLGESAPPTMDAMVSNRTPFIRSRVLRGDSTLRSRMARWNSL